MFKKAKQPFRTREKNGDVFEGLFLDFEPSGGKDSLGTVSWTPTKIRPSQEKAPSDSVTKSVLTLQKKSLKEKLWEEFQDGLGILVKYSPVVFFISLIILIVVTIFAFWLAKSLNIDVKKLLLLILARVLKGSLFGIDLEDILTEVY